MRSPRRAIGPTRSQEYIVDKVNIIGVPDMKKNKYTKIHSI
jgi:hypothetical protein